jgi:hypothetical protein
MLGALRAAALQHCQRTENRCEQVMGGMRQTTMVSAKKRFEYRFEGFLGFPLLSADILQC